IFFEIEFAILGVDTAVIEKDVAGVVRGIVPIDRRSVSRYERACFLQSGRPERAIEHRVVNLGDQTRKLLTFLHGQAPYTRFGNKALQTERKPKPAQPM